MSLIRTVGPDGVVNYRQDPPDPDRPVVFTGPIKGEITLTDGSTYNVSDDYVEADSHEAAGELSHYIGLRHESEGHPGHTEDEPFVHVCTEQCGNAAREEA